MLRLASNFCRGWGVREAMDQNELRPSITSIVQALLTSLLREDDTFQHTEDWYRSIHEKRALDNPEVASKVKRILAEVLGSHPQRRDGDRVAFINNHRGYGPVRDYQMTTGTTPRPARCHFRINYQTGIRQLPREVASRSVMATI